MQLLMTMRAKGVRGTAERLGSILARFEAGAARMEGYIQRYVDVAASYGAQPSLPITATVLARHAGLVRRFADQGVEFAIHGLVHSDHSKAGLDRQFRDLKLARAIFERVGLRCEGFRGPYLRFNAATDEAVRAVGLRYHSSQAVVFPVLPVEIECGTDGRGYRMALEFYRALDARDVAVRPRTSSGLIQIPVALPDDEILVDRLHFDEEQQAKTWLAILALTHARGELFTVQLHAERILQMGEALRVVLAQSRELRPRVWIARLDELAAWWTARARATIRLTERGLGRFLVEVQGPPEATVLVRGVRTESLPEGAADWYGSDRVLCERAFELVADRRPAIGVSRRTSEEARAFLAEEGFLWEETEAPESHGAFVDVPAGQFEEQALLARLEEAPGPLVRLWRWPNGARSALALTGDVDSITLVDFALRLWETRR